MAAANYTECEDRVLAHEGSRYTDGVHPYDPGGPTRWGITLTDARLYWKPKATADDVRNMPRVVAEDIYRKHYWAPMRGDELPAGVDDTVYDYGINSGLGRSGKVLRRVLGLPDKDWHVTDEVLAALKLRDPVKVISAICDERMMYLRSLKIWPTYRTGWTIRVREVRDFSIALAGAPALKRAPTPIPSSTMGKGLPPPPTVAKQVNVGVGGTVATGSVVASVLAGADVSTSASIFAAVAAVVGIGHEALDRLHRVRAETPMVGTEIVSETMPQEETHG